MGVIWAPSNTVQICGTKSKNQHFLCKYCGRMPLFFNFSSSISSIIRMATHLFAVCALDLCVACVQIDDLGDGTSIVTVVFIC